ncbi:MAG: ribosome-associated translation inhibitor RaiA [Rhizobiales bacterium]|nr:ribosome-associated translation inhibitor RaiA [Hyphomicrobiales bacterium]
MSIRVSGKNLDVGEALRSHITDQIDAAVAKYFDGGYTAHVIIEREASAFKTDCMVHLDTGIDLQANGVAQDAHPSFDKAAERIEKRLRRYKRKLKDHRAAGNSRSHEVLSYILAGPGEDDDVTDEEGAPIIIAENAAVIRTMTVSTAVMAMDLANQDVYVFRNPDSGEINVLHKRQDGNIGWIDPSQS